VKRDVTLLKKPKSHRKDAKNTKVFLVFFALFASSRFKSTFFQWSRFVLEVGSFRLKTQIELQS